MRNQIWGVHSFFLSSFSKVIFEDSVRVRVHDEMSSPLLAASRAWCASTHRLRPVGIKARAAATQWNQEQRSLLSTSQPEGDERPGFLARFMGPRAAEAGPDFKARSAMFVPAFATHVCLGAPYGWSAISAALSREYGIVASSSADWMLDQCTYPMSIMVREPIL